MTLFAVTYFTILTLNSLHSKHRSDYLEYGILAPLMDQKLFDTPFLYFYTLLLILVSRVVVIALPIYYAIRTKFIDALIMLVVSIIVSNILVWFIHFHRKRRMIYSTIFGTLSLIGFVIQPVLLVIVWFSV
jgi:hypothetical protein